MPKGEDEDVPLPLSEAQRPRKFKRKHLMTTLPAEMRERFVDETYKFLQRRYEKLAVSFDDISKTNFNPFLLLITAPIYNIFSPLEVAERLQLAKAFHGDDTAFGKLAEDKFLTIFGAERPKEKNAKEKLITDRWSPIDLEVEVEGQRYLMSIKAGPWTMNQSHAHEMSAQFAALRKDTKANIIIGITYGRYKNLNNKPLKVKTELGDPNWYDYLVGKDLWEFVSGVENVHKEIFAAVRTAQQKFSEEHFDETFNEKILANRLRISASLRQQFRVGSDDDFWATLFNSMFESDAGLPGKPDKVPPIKIEHKKPKA